MAAGWSAIGAGCAGLAGLFSTLPWPELFSIDATPRNAVVRDPELLTVLVGHYAVLAAGGLLGLLAGLLLGVELRRRRPTAAAALLVAAGSGTMGYAALRTAIDLATHDGRSTIELEPLVWTGGGLVLVGTALLSIALRHAGRTLVVLGLASPVLVSGGTAIFVVLGPEAYPTIWGLTFPPPSDYLLAAWFIVLGWLAKGEASDELVGRSPIRGAHRRRKPRRGRSSSRQGHRPRMSNERSSVHVGSE